MFFYSPNRKCVTLAFDRPTGWGEKPSGQYLSLICDESLTCHGLNSNPGHFGDSATIYLCFMWRIAFVRLVVYR
jgi:hypothetical protein